MNFKKSHLLCFILGMLCTMPLLAGTNASQAQNFSKIPLMELDGRLCTGYLQATLKYLDFYTPYFDCHRMKVSHLMSSDQPITLFDRQFNSAWMTLDQPTKKCPFAVIEVLTSVDPDEQGVRQIIGYPDKTSFDKKRWGIDPATGQYSGGPDLLTCPGYVLEPNEKAHLKPESKRAKPQVRR